MNKEIKTIEDLEKEVKNSENTEIDNINTRSFEASISQDGRHLLCRLPKSMMESFAVLEDVADKEEEKTILKLKDRLTKKWKIVFEDIDYEDRSGKFRIIEK